MRRAAALLACLALAGCGGDDERPAERPAATPTPTRSPGGTGVDVRVTMRDAPGPAAYAERCAADACVRRWQRLLERREDSRRACIELYGGPETARVTGSVAGRDVDVTFSREDGCAISDYEALFALLERPPPVRR